MTPATPIYEDYPKRRGRSKNVICSRKWDLLDIEEFISQALDTFAQGVYHAPFLQLTEDERVRVIRAMKSNLAERINTGRAA